jgi:uncharacterized damage-inducible protein DinB
VATEPDLGTTTIKAMHIRMTAVLPAQIRACVEQLDDDQLWWRPNPRSNSVGHLVLHVSGAIMEFVCRRIGGFPYERNRAAEFDEKQRVSRDVLLQTFNSTIEKAADTLGRMSVPRLSEPSTNPDYYSLLFEDLLGATVHMAIHTGQIVFVTKMLKEGSVDELWFQAHREAGAWRK